MLREGGRDEENDRMLSPVKESLLFFGELGPRSFVNVPLANKRVGLVFSSKRFFLTPLGVGGVSVVISFLPISSLSQGFWICDPFVESCASWFCSNSSRLKVNR